MRSYPIPFLTLLLIGFLAIGAILFTLFFSLNSASIGPQHSPSTMAIIPLIVFGMIAVSFGFWIFGLVHLILNKAIEGNDRIAWLLIVILLHAVGAVLYFFIAPQPYLANLPAHLREKQNA